MGNAEVYSSNAEIDLVNAEVDGPNADVSRILTDDYVNPLKSPLNTL